MGGSLENRVPLDESKELTRVLKGGGRKKTGGSILADISIPAGFLFFHEFLKRRNLTIRKNTLVRKPKKSKKNLTKKSSKKK